MNNVEIILYKLRKTYKLDFYRRDDPFYVLITTVLSQRSRDPITLDVSGRLFSKYKNAKELAMASVKDIEKIIKKIGFYRVKAERIKQLAEIVVRTGNVPDNIDELLKLPGVGRKTANCVLVYAYKIPAIVVDTHVHRISNRLGLVKTKNPEQTEEALMKILPKKYWLEINELLVKFGQTTCRPISPKCKECIIEKLCKFKQKNI